jgi:hypothetical protein
MHSAVAGRKPADHPDTNREVRMDSPRVHQASFPLQLSS